MSQAFRFTEDEVESGSGMTRGMYVTDVTVVHPDGQETKFFIGLRMKRGRAICEVANNGVAVGKSTVKTVTGNKFKRK